MSAVLLKKAGYDVSGVFIKVWQPDWIECDWKEERLEAMRAAAHLEIPFFTLDLEKEYKEGVIDYMIREYSLGRTPNPDVMCNREVKFGAFWRWAKENGAGFIATGHYARNQKTSAGFKLLTGADAGKDQSYFLWTLNQSDLEHVLFPVGHLQKSEVRELAKSFGLPNADKKDSQGLCFIGKVDVKEFLRHYVKSAPGDVSNEKGEMIGRHEGALLLTIGERHGFTITKKTPEDLPYYVVKKDISSNTVTVSNKDGALRSAATAAQISRTNWVASIPGRGTSVETRCRYREALSSATVGEISNGGARLLFEDPQTALTPGQSLVMYRGDECLGGGIIV